MKDFRLTSSGAAAVSAESRWRAVGPDTPRGVKVQLISEKYGVAQYGTYQPDNKFFTHWAPLPTFERT